MGWWSEYIMGGDEPLDNLDHFCRIMGVGCDFEQTEDDTFHGYPVTAELLDEYLDDLVSELDERGKHYVSIAGQVLAAMLLHTGATIPDDLKDRLIQCAQADPWMQDDGRNSSRAVQINNLITALKTHIPGSRTSLEDVGLLEKFAQLRAAQ